MCSVLSASTSVCYVCTAHVVQKRGVRSPRLQLQRVLSSHRNACIQNGLLQEPPALFTAELTLSLGPMRAV